MVRNGGGGQGKAPTKEADPKYMAGIELDLIRVALAQAGGVVAHAAQLLGLRRTTLVEKLRKYGIERDGLELTAEL